MAPEQCTLPADEAGRILDRLAGLEQVIPPDLLWQALTATGRVSTRSCVLTFEVILWVVLAMGLLIDVPDSQANAVAFSRPSAGPRGDGAFPQVKKLSLVELATHVEVAFTIKHGHASERAMVAGLLRYFTSREDAAKTSPEGRLRPE